MLLKQKAKKKLDRIKKKIVDDDGDDAVAVVVVVVVEFVVEMLCTEETSRLRSLALWSY